MSYIVTAQKAPSEQLESMLCLCTKKNCTFGYYRSLIHSQLCTNIKTDYKFLLKHESNIPYLNSSNANIIL